MNIKLKAAKPKFKEGDWVKATYSGDKSIIGQIIATRFADDGIFYQVEGAEEWLFSEKNVEPYNELISQNSSEICDTENHISTDNNTSQDWPICENHSGDTSHESGILMKITSRSPIAISIIQVKDKGAQV